MNIIDVILFLLFCYAITKGIIKGFVVEAASFVGVILGIYCAMLYAPAASNSVCEWFSCQNTYGTPIAYCIIFLTVILLCHFCAKILDKTLDIFLLGWLNKLLGGVFGLIKYLLITSIVLNLFHSIDEHTKLISQDKKECSLFYFPVKKLAPAILPYINAEDFGEKQEAD